MMIQGCEMDFGDTCAYPVRYEIWSVAFTENDVIHNCRPSIIVGTNPDSDMVTVVPLTSQLCYRQKSTHLLVEGHGLEQTSRGLCEFVVTVPASRLRRQIGYLSDSFDRYALRHALAVHLGLTEYDDCRGA